MGLRVLVPRSLVAAAPRDDGWLQIGHPSAACIRIARVVRFTRGRQKIVALRDKSSTAAKGEHEGSPTGGKPVPFPDYCQWSMVNGQWSVVRGPLSVVGEWYGVSPVGANLVFALRCCGGFCCAVPAFIFCLPRVNLTTREASGYTPRKDVRFSAIRHPEERQRRGISERRMRALPRSLLPPRLGMTALGQTRGVSMRWDQRANTKLAPNRRTFAEDTLASPRAMQVTHPEQPVVRRPCPV